MGQRLVCHPFAVVASLPCSRRCSRSPAAAPTTRRAASRPGPVRGRAGPDRSSTHSERAARRGPGGLQGPDRHAQGLPGRREQVGVVVRARAVRSSRTSSGRRLRLGKQVAFLGVDSNDNDDDARSSSRSTRCRTRATRTRRRDRRGVQGPIAFPTTAFYDSKGKLAYVEAGRLPVRGRTWSTTSSATRASGRRQARPRRGRAGARLREQVFCVEQGVRSRPTRTGSTTGRSIVAVEARRRDRHVPGAGRGASAASAGWRSPRARGQGVGAAILAAAEQLRT